MPRFELGRVVATPGAMMFIPENAMLAALRRHAAGDWGLVDEADAAENEIGVKRGFRLLSAYEHGGIPFYLVTECDRSATTLLLPSEY